MPDPGEYEGWILDVYADRRDGVVVWLLTADGTRLRLHQDFPITFYAAGKSKRLRELWQSLEAQPVQVKLRREERRDLFLPDPIPVLSVEVSSAADQPQLFHQVAAGFPELTFYDADLPLALRYGAATGAYTLARCRVKVGASDRLETVTALETPWDLNPVPPPLRILACEPDVNPSHATPQRLSIFFQERSYGLSMQPIRPLLLNLRAILREHDPDLLLTTWGDTWLLPALIEWGREWHIYLPLNRDPGHGVARRAEKTYFSYGQVIHRGQQIHLFGRWHIDRCNAMLWGDYGLEGILELGRVTGLPVQTAARVSPGTGISSMQILTALRQGVLVPWHKQQVEAPRTAHELFYSDQGGLVYQPLVGLHANVAEIDFISMYPSVMVRFNISPETVGSRSEKACEIPGLGLAIDSHNPGLVPQTLEPLLRKRIAVKFFTGSLPAWDPRRKNYAVWSSAHKWLLVTCFGYLGYKNARFGRIEAHQAVTAYGREALLRAKEAAETAGCTVLHLYVDGLWVTRPGAREPADFQPILDRIGDETGLPVALDGVYRWIAFLPSTRDDRVPVANRYFGVFQDGTIKVRGIDARRQDTPPFIAHTQMEIIELFAPHEAGELRDCIPGAIAILRRTLAALRAGCIPLADCLATQKLSRTLDEYRAASSVSRAVAQLKAVGKNLRPGQRVRFLYLRSADRVHAWDLPDPPSPAELDVERYTTLLLRAAHTVLQPLGLGEAEIRTRVLGLAVSPELPGVWRIEDGLVPGVGFGLRPRGVSVKVDGLIADGCS